MLMSQAVQDFCPQPLSSVQRRQRLSKDQLGLGSGRESATDAASGTGKLPNFLNSSAPRTMYHTALILTYVRFHTELLRTPYPYVALLEIR